MPKDNCFPARKKKEENPEKKISVYIQDEQGREGATDQDGADPDGEAAGDPDPDTEQNEEDGGDDE